MKLTTRLRAAASAAVEVFRKGMPLTGVHGDRGWLSLWSSNRDATWQTDTVLDSDTILKSTAVYSCVTLIASDVGKICVELKTKHEASDIWIEAEAPAFSPVLRKPNGFQTRQQFIECWVLSKLIHGNAYVLKERDARQVVKAMYVLDPSRVLPLIAPDGSVFYQLMRDDLSKVPVEIPAVPASEIIHDRMECLFHPLVGISPLYAANLPASQGLRIQQNSEKFFLNMSRPSGILTAPGKIDDETAKRLKKEWDTNFSGGNMGKIAVAGNDLKYMPLAVSAIDAQLVEQLKMSAEQICSVFHVPAYMVGVGATPSYNNIEALNQQYYSQCLQKIFNAIEDLLDEGLGLRAAGYRTEFDIDDLLRMDTAGRVKAATELVAGSILSPNEGREKFDMLPVDGGNSPMIQQQNYSLAALAKRDAKPDPFGTAKPADPPPVKQFDVREFVKRLEQMDLIDG